MQSTIYTYYAFLLCYILVCQIFISHAVPISEDNYWYNHNPGVIQLNSLRIPSNTVDQPESKVSSVNWDDLLKIQNNPRPHKRHQDHVPQINENIDSCCPSVEEIVEPRAGKDMSGHLVELYQTETEKQRFHEISCDPAVLNKHCKFVDRKHHEYSRCEQQYSYSYALVWDSESETNNGVRMDYIQVRSGCACKIDTSVRAG